MTSARAHWRPAHFATRVAAAALAITLAPALAHAAKPAVGFTWAPEVPAAGQAVLFTAAVAARPPIVEWLWDFDGDQISDAVGASATATFAAPGTHAVRLVAIAVNGKSATADRIVTVGQPVPKPAPAALAPAIIPPAATAAPAPAAPAPAPAAPAPHLLTPFPIVRIQGGLVPGGVMITRLIVQAPAGARVRALCHGRGCPARSVVRRARSARLPVRLRPLERRLGAGAVLEVFVTDAAAVGKYTRFVIRRGAAPARRDLCVVPTAGRPTRCPGA